MTIRSAGSNLRAHGMRRLVLALVLVFSLDAAAGPGEDLLGELLPELTHPQNRCAALAAEADHLEATLSLHRAELTRVVVQVDGRALGDTETGALLELAFERRLIGPDTVRVRLSGSARGVTPRQRLEAFAVDPSGAMHPLFCGLVYAVDDDGRAGQVSIAALRPRAGRERARTREFMDMTRVEVIQAVANEAGLPVTVQSSRALSTLARVSQRHVDDWRFLRQLAGTEHMELVVAPGPGLRLADSTFTPPTPSMPQRQFTDMTWHDVVAALAAELGLQVDMAITQPFPVTTLTQADTDLRFAHALAAAHQHSVFLSGDRLLIRDDGVWRENPAIQSPARLRSTALDLARQISRRYRLPLEAAGVGGAPITVARGRQTDSEFLLTVLADQGLRLEPRDGVLHLRRSIAPGDVADLLLLRATIVPGSRAPVLSRRFAAVRQQLLAPLDVATTELRLEIGPARRAPPASYRNPPQIDASPAAQAVAQGLAEGRSAAAGDARQQFLLDVAQVYRPTLIFLRSQQPSPLSVAGPGLYSRP